MHHSIVALEGLHLQIPDFDIAPPNSGTLTVYSNTAKHEVAERVKDATIIISTTVALDASTLDPNVTPNLQLIAALATGTDHIDLEACRRRGVAVINTPGANIDAVAQHALSLFFAARRRTVLLHNNVATSGEWKKNGSLARYIKTPDGGAPLLCQEEVAGIVGYGLVGKRVEGLARALGMKVLVADRKGTGGKASDGSVERTPFEEVVRQATVVFLTLPRTPESVNLISTKELNAMSPKAVIINVSRGGIVDEEAIVKALKEGRIAGYGTDVTTVEPADGGKDTPLLADDAKGLNITISPHLAWCAGMTLKNLQRILKENVESWVAGTPRNVIVSGSPIENGI